MKTAMQQAYQEIIDIPNKLSIPMDIIQQITSIMHKHLETEKQQIVEAYKTGRDHDFNAFEHAGDYYYKTFNNQ